MHRVAGAALLVIALTACSQQSITVSDPKRAFPSEPVPVKVAGLTRREEPSAQRAFSAVGPTSTVAVGKVWSLRDGDALIAAVQVAQLKGGLDTRTDRVRGGIRSAIGNGHYRWFKVAGRQWVGLQRQPESSIYLWFPPRSDVFVVVQVTARAAQPEQIVTALVEGQGELT